MTAAGAELADTPLADRYRLLERIAVGGMGEVWRAEDLLLSRLVAVKTLRAEYSSASDRARFRAEARHAARLAHPGIASVFDFGETDDRAWLVMELVEGEPLSQLLHREAPLSVDRTLDVVEQTAVALHAAHLGGVVHRDVKPGNLLLRPDGVLKVTDFGIASAVDAPSLTQTGLVVGTAYYLSPEQAAGRRGSPASDVYALGVVAYECLTGERPYRGDSAVSVALAHLQQPLPELPGTVPAGVRELVLRALAKDPQDRFPDAATMAMQARALRTGPAAGTAAGTAGRPGSTRLPGSGRRSARAAVSSSLVLLVVLAAGAAVRSAVSGPDTPSGSDAPAASRTAAGTVDVDGYAGRTGEEVEAALIEQGLLPRLRYDGTGSAVGTVSAVDPGGDVTVGSEVVVHVVPAPEPVSPASSSASSSASVAPTPASPPAAVPDQVPASSPAPSTAPEPAPPAAGPAPDVKADKPGKGQKSGNGGGKGRGGG